MEGLSSYGDDDEQYVRMVKILFLFIVEVVGDG